MVLRPLVESCQIAAHGLILSVYAIRAPRESAGVKKIRFELSIPIRLYPLILRDSRISATKGKAADFIQANVVNSADES